MRTHRWQPFTSSDNTGASAEIPNQIHFFKKLMEVWSRWGETEFWQAYLLRSILFTARFVDMLALNLEIWRDVNAVKIRCFIHISPQMTTNQTNEQQKLNSQPTRKKTMWNFTLSLLPCVVGPVWVLNFGLFWGSLWKQRGTRRCALVTGECNHLAWCCPRWEVPG